MTTEPVPAQKVKPPRKPRRTREQIAAERGSALAHEVEQLPLAQLSSFVGALSNEIAEYLQTLLGGRGL